MQNIQETREMLAQIGAACVQITLGCQDCQRPENEEELLPALQELEYALAELYTNARKLRENAMSTGKLDSVNVVRVFLGAYEKGRAEIEAELDHDGKTEPANEVPPDPVCKCGHRKTEHMAEGPFLHALCVRCECDGFQEK